MKFQRTIVLFTAALNILACSNSSVFSKKKDDGKTSDVNAKNSVSIALARPNIAAKLNLTTIAVTPNPTKMCPIGMPNCGDTMSLSCKKDADGCSMCSCVPLSTPSPTKLCPVGMPNCGDLDVSCTVDSDGCSHCECIASSPTSEPVGPSMEPTIEPSTVPTVIPVHKYFSYECDASSEPLIGGAWEFELVSLAAEGTGAALLETADFADNCVNAKVRISNLEAGQKYQVYAKYLAGGISGESKKFVYDGQTSAFTTDDSIVELVMKPVSYNNDVTIHVVFDDKDKGSMIRLVPSAEAGFVLPTVKELDASILLTKLEDGKGLASFEPWKDSPCGKKKDKNLGASFSCNNGYSWTVDAGIAIAEPVGAKLTGKTADGCVPVSQLKQQAADICNGMVPAAVDQMVSFDEKFEAKVEPGQYQFNIGTSGDAVCVEGCMGNITVTKDAISEISVVFGQPQYIYALGSKK